MSDPAPFHVGFAVGDLDAAVATHQATGVTEWVYTDWRTGRYFDAGAGAVIEPRSRVAYGRISDTFAIEFIEVDPTGPVPLVWQIAGGIGRGHVGHWVEDTAAPAAALLREGGRIVMARTSSPAVEALTVEQASDPDSVPDGLDACYVLMPSGQVIELVPGRIWDGRLTESFGPNTQRVIPPPPGTGPR